jgi:hypothetical protein
MNKGSVRVFEVAEVFVLPVDVERRESRRKRLT